MSGHRRMAKTMTSPLHQLQVVMVGTRNPLNMGAAARAMSNFDARSLRVVRPWELAFREARSAVGASQLLAEAEVYESLAQAVADCSLVVGTTSASRRELHQPLRTLAEGAPLIRKRLRSGRVALLFGSEKVGLSNSDLAHCHWLLRIPTCSDHGSMNLGQAVAVCLYELARKNGTISSKERPRHAEAGDLERMTELLFDAARQSGYVKPRTSEVTKEKLRRMVRRLQMAPEDSVLWLGLLRQIDWALSRREHPERSDNGEKP